MEGLTRLVAESLARHGCDRPLDYRRLRWSRWFRCESPHSLLFVPSKPGVFALAEEMTHVGTAAPGCPAERSSAVEERGFSPASGDGQRLAALAAAGDRFPEVGSWTAGARRMLAVTQFFEDDDMAFVLDRMLSRPNPMRERLNSGRYFIRYVVIEDPAQRRSICSALNQWMVSAAEKATGIGAHFASSLELLELTEARVGAGESAAQADAITAHVGAEAFVRPASETSMIQSHAASSAPAPQLDSGAATNIHRPSPFPSGF